jgi:cell division protein FtsQ
MWDNARQLNVLSAALATIATVVMLTAFTRWLVRQPAFEFRQVEIRGPLQHASAPHLEAVIREELRGTFFTMDLAKAAASLARVPWVRHVSLRREWPNRLEIKVDEQSALARWNDAALVNTQGEVFAASYNGELPQFSGPDGTSAEVTGKYREFGDVLKPIGLTIDEIRRSARGGWELHVQGATPLTLALGRSDPLERLVRFSRNYVRTVERLSRAGTHVDYADLRYRNGFAVRVPGFKEKPVHKAG